MNKIRTASLVLTCSVAAALGAFSADAGNDPRSTPPAKAQIDALPPVGTGHDMVKPYKQDMPAPIRDRTDERGVNTTRPAPKPLSREIVPPTYRYGTPGYTPDGRGGRGYDFGYPGYREQGGGYPHQRPFGIRR